MKTINVMKGFLAIIGSALFGLMLATVADAANPEQVPVAVEFVDPITITENNALQYGLLDQNLNGGEMVIIAPDGAVTDAFSRVVGGTQAAADLTVDATAARSITILVDNITNNTGYTLGTFMCNYDGAASDSACDGAGYGETTIGSATLLVGATLTGDGNAIVGVFNGNFDVTVTYL